MSEIETHIGKLKRLSDSIDIEEWVKEKCIEQKIQKCSYHDSWLDVWNDEHYNESGYILSVNGEYYEVIEDTDIEEGDIVHITKNNDGTYDYIMQFYNGGTCLPEAIEEGIMNLKDKL